MSAHHYMSRQCAICRSDLGACLYGPNVCRDCKSTPNDEFTRGARAAIAALYFEAGMFDDEARVVTHSGAFEGCADALRDAT